LPLVHQRLICATQRQGLPRSVARVSLRALGNQALSLNVRRDALMIFSAKASSAFRVSP
jgi:hypothetical protein